MRPVPAAAPRNAPADFAHTLTSAPTVRLKVFAMRMYLRVAAVGARVAVHVARPAGFVRGAFDRRRRPGGRGSAARRGGRLHGDFGRECRPGGSSHRLERTGGEPDPSSDETAARPKTGSLS